jgi:RHS repeat-associated protein
MEPIMDIDRLVTRRYDAYGYRVARIDAARSGFCGEVNEANLPWYLLGNRFYVPSLRRFLGPDPTSPFSEGGLNRYAYCSGDPINRIDPTGEVSRNWLAARIEDALAPWIGLLASDDRPASVFTPAAAALTVTAFIDSVADVAQLASVASRSAGNERMGSAFGWLGTGDACIGPELSLGAKVRAPRLGPWEYVGTSFRLQSGYKRTTYSALSGNRWIKVYEGVEAVNKKIPSRAIKNWNGETTEIKPVWTSYRNNNGGVNYVTDVPIRFTGRLNNLSSAIRASGDANPVMLLSGVHGTRNGHNWSWNGRRMYDDRSVYLNDVANVADMQRLVGPSHEVRIVDIGGISSRGFKRLVDEPAHIVHAYCCSGADWKLMKWLNISEMKIFLP